MCRTIEELKAKVTKDVTEEVTKKVNKKKAMEIALNLITLGIEKDKVVIATGLNADEVNKLADFELRP